MLIFPRLVGGLFVVLVAAAFLTSDALAATCGKASFYCCKHNGRPTASGEIFSEHKMTAAVPSRRQFGTYRVTHNGKSVTVRANDTGGFAKYGRVIDLSKAAFAKLAPTTRGVIRVCIERL